MGLLSRGQAMLNRALGESEGVSVSSARKVSGTTYTVTLTARIGRTLFAGLQEQAVAVQWGEADLLVEVADLVLNSQQTTPQRGDRVTRADGTVWEAASPDTNEAVWRYSDITRTLFRIHLKRMA